MVVVSRLEVFFVLTHTNARVVAVSSNENGKKGQMGKRQVAIGFLSLNALA